MKIYNFKAKTNNLKYPILTDVLLEDTNLVQYNMDAISKTIKKLMLLKSSSTSSVEDFNDTFGTSEDETVSWNDFNLEFFHNPDYLLPSSSSVYMFIIRTENVTKYGIDNLSGNLVLI